MVACVCFNWFLPNKHTVYVISKTHKRWCAVLCVCTFRWKTMNRNAAKALLTAAVDSTAIDNDQLRQIVVRNNSFFKDFLLVVCCLVFFRNRFGVYCLSVCDNAFRRSDLRRSHPSKSGVVVQLGLQKHR
ncbi:ac108 [Lambdina fiscellaria nucleopolyhedrovirus]|uniref:Ac108 n=1 Tax=Lambdina fiscellaria nucleopolyhedrovirus TaxID=1642929 RepID=A0A0E3Z6R0_9ABAC|nr:ac108 [Lambdina fiscellaria nucleopolyhedrovirus]AKC91672.1 ac108 [Lambdina fiscellaria nucleopolyhedrovirus]